MEPRTVILAVFFAPGYIQFAVNAQQGGAGPETIPDQERIPEVNYGRLERVAVAAFYLPDLPGSIFDQTMALPYHLYVISTQVPGMPLTVQYGTALVLLLFTLSLTFVATMIRTTMRRRREW